MYVSAATDTYIVCDGYKCYALSCAPYQLFVLYTSAIPTFAMRSDTQTHRQARQIGGHTLACLPKHTVVPTFITVQYTVSSHAVVNRTVSSHTMSGYVTLYRSVLYRTISHYVVSYHAIPIRSAPYRTVQYHVYLPSYHSIPYHTVSF